MGKQSEGEVFGRKGGQATVKKYGREHMREIALKRHRKERREKAKLAKAQKSA